MDTVSSLLPKAKDNDDLNVDNYRFVCLHLISFAMLSILPRTSTENRTVENGDVS